MAFTIVESILLWGPPLVTIAFAFGYYFWWGKEEDERFCRVSYEQTTSERE